MRTGLLTFMSLVTVFRSPLEEIQILIVSRQGRVINYIQFPLALMPRKLEAAPRLTDRPWSERKSQREVRSRWLHRFGSSEDCGLVTPIDSFPASVYSAADLWRKVPCRVKCIPNGGGLRLSSCWSSFPSLRC